MEFDANDLLIDWNMRFGFDRIWRKKYGIPFGSEAHRQANQIDIMMDIMEDRMFDTMRKEHFKAKKDMEDLERTGKVLKVRKTSKKESDRLFNMLRSNIRNKK